VTEDRLIAAVQKGGDQTPVERQRAMAEAVDPRVDAMNPVCREPAIDGGFPNTGTEQLSAADHAVLASRKLCDRFCIPLAPLSGGHGTQSCHAPDGGRRNVTEPRSLCPFIAEVRPASGTRLEGVSDEATKTLDDELLDDDELTSEAEEPEGLDEEALERRNAALSQVVKFGDPVLKSAASPVTEFDDRLAEEAERMIGLMRDAIGVGLAATQLGALRRMLVFQVGSEAEPTVMVNPEIEWRSEDAATAEEGCLSLPGVVVDVERPLFVRARAVDPRGEPFTVEASGLEARVIQHEIDHLDGVLMLDRTEKDQRKGALRALREGGTYAPDRSEDEE
jgi:peptide deformylase